MINPAQRKKIRVAYSKYLQAGLSASVARDRVVTHYALELETTESEIDLELTAYLEAEEAEKQRQQAKQDAVANAVFPVIDDKGKPLTGSRANFKFFLQDQGIRVARILGSHIIIHSDGTIQPITDEVITELASIGFDNYSPRYDIDIQQLTSFISLEATSSADAIAEWVTSAAWDGVDRISQLYDALNAEPYDIEFQKKVFEKFIVGMVMQSLGTEGVRNELMLIIYSPRQGNGKTQYCRRLAPSSFPTELYHEGVLDGGKDFLMLLSETVVYIASEIDASFRKADAGRIKEILTLHKYKLRRPYGRISSDYKRTCSFVGSTNEAIFLPAGDEGRRFLVLTALGDINYEHDIDMQQVYAQAVHKYMNGDKVTWLTASEVKRNKIANKRYSWADTVDIFYQRCCKPVKEEVQWVTLAKLYSAYTMWCEYQEQPKTAIASFGVFRCHISALVLGEDYWREIDGELHVNVKITINNKKPKDIIQVICGYL